MTNAYKDENGVSTIIGVSSSDGSKIVRVTANPLDCAISVDDDTTGTDYGARSAHRDENNVPVLLAVSSVDGVTPVEVYVDEVTGRLLIDSH